jgi:hypothetical protein
LEYWYDALVTIDMDQRQEGSEPGSACRAFLHAFTA